MSRWRCNFHFDWKHIKRNIEWISIRFMTTVLFCLLSFSCFACFIHRHRQNNNNDSIVHCNDNRTGKTINYCDSFSWMKLPIDCVWNVCVCFRFDGGFEGIFRASARHRLAGNLVCAKTKNCHATMRACGWRRVLQQQSTKHVLQIQRIETRKNKRNWMENSCEIFISIAELLHVLFGVGRHALSLMSCLTSITVWQSFAASKKTKKEKKTTKKKCKWFVGKNGGNFRPSLFPFCFRFSQRENFN